MAGTVPGTFDPYDPEVQKNATPKWVYFLDPGDRMEVTVPIEFPGGVALQPGDVGTVTRVLGEGPGAVATVRMSIGAGASHDEFSFDATAKQIHPVPQHQRRIPCDIFTCTIH